MRKSSLIRIAHKPPQTTNFLEQQTLCSRPSCPNVFIRPLANRLPLLLRVVWIIDAIEGGGEGFPIAGKQDGEGADVCAMAAHWSTFGALHRWRGRTGATCGGLQVREGGEGREETKPPLGLERFLGFLSFPRSSREEFALSSWIWTTHHPPQGERKRVWGDSKLFYCFFLVCRVELILSRGLIDEDCEIFWLMRDGWLNVFECLVISFLFFF